MSSQFTLQTIPLFILQDWDQWSFNQSLVVYPGAQLYFMMFSMYLNLAVIYYPSSTSHARRDIRSPSQTTKSSFTNQMNFTSLPLSQIRTLDTWMVISLFLHSKQHFQPALVPWTLNYGIVGVLISITLT